MKTQAQTSREEAVGYTGHGGPSSAAACMPGRGGWWGGQLGLCPSGCGSWFTGQVRARPS